MAVEDSLPIPRYGQIYPIYFPVFHETGVVQHVEGVTATVSVDRGLFLPSTNPVTAIHDSGYFYLELTEEEMTARVVIVQPDPNNNDYRTPPLIIYPEQPGDMRTHTLTIEEMVSDDIAIATLSSSVPGPHGPDTLGGMLAGVVGNLPTKLVIVSPVVEGGNLLIVKGDDYLTVDGRALTWTENSGTWPDLSEATVHLIIGDRRFFRKEITAPTPSGNPKVVRAELTRTETAKLTQASYPFVVEATMGSGSRVTLIKGYVRTTAGI
jgi:hypothetical protein